MLAIIAGNGGLVSAVVGERKTKPYIAALEGFVPDGVTPDRIFRIEHLGSLIADLSEMGVGDVCFAGGIRRPKVDPAQIDAATMPLVPRIAAAIAAGDDGALRAVLGFFEEAGMNVVAAHEIAPGLLLPEGIPTAAQPAPEADADVLRAIAVLDAMGAADLGQACVVQRGQVLAVEALPGTTWMLESLKTYPSAGALFYKAPKPEQDRRADLPTIGPDTIRAAVDAGLQGIVIEAGGVMVIDQAETLRLADAAGLFLWVRAR